MATVLARSGRIAQADGLALLLLGATQAAAVACVPWIGRGDPDGADGAAVAAMRAALACVPGRGRVVLGEGEKDKAPMLWAGEEVGTGDGLAFELAVDPLEGTRSCARGIEGAVSVLAAAPPRHLWTTHGWYLEKLVVGPEAAELVDLEAPVDVNLGRVSSALGRPVTDLVVAVQDRPRHMELVTAVRKAGAAVVLFADGDVMASLQVLIPGGGVDLLMGVGGAPEGTITACAVQLLGGGMQARLAPQSEEEQARLAGEGADLEQVLTVDDLVSTGDCCFVATGVTGGPLLDRPRPRADGWWTWSLLSTPAQPFLLVQGPADPPDGIPARN
jgi:fructose-1,6-bisphosphatase II